MFFPRHVECLENIARNPGDLQITWNTPGVRVSTVHELEREFSLRTRGMYVGLDIIELTY